jgi:hypothetical protein
MDNDADDDVAEDDEGMVLRDRVSMRADSTKRRNDHLGICPWEVFLSAAFLTLHVFNTKPDTTYSTATWALERAGIFPQHPLSTPAETPLVCLSVCLS